MSEERTGVQICIADEWANVQAGLRVMLEQQPGLEVAGQVANVRELLAQLENDCPDVLLLSWELPGLVDPILLPALRLACPELVVIVLSGRPDAQQAARAAGADAFVSKAAPPERLLAAVLSAAKTGSDRHSASGGGPNDPQWRESMA